MSLIMQWIQNCIFTCLLNYLIFFYTWFISQVWKVCNNINGANCPATKYILFFVQSHCSNTLTLYVYKRPTLNLIYTFVSIYLDNILLFDFMSVMVPFIVGKIFFFFLLLFRYFVPSEYIFLHRECRYHSEASVINWPQSGVILPMHNKEGKTTLI